MFGYRKFVERNLAQIKTVYPDAFIFRQERGSSGHSETYQLTIECNLKEGSNQQASSLIRRRRVFEQKLCSIVKEHHRKFLAHLDPPLDIPDHKVLRWHSEFPLDSVPEIKEADLPTPPTNSGVCLTLK